MSNKTSKKAHIEPLKVQTYLREKTGVTVPSIKCEGAATTTAQTALDCLTKEFAIEVTQSKKYPNLYLLKYNMIDSPMSEPVVQECRGIILDSTDNWRVISRSFDKFFNESEGHADKIDWSENVTVQEKVDGSLMVLYRYNNEWCVQTSGTPDASGQVHDCEGMSFNDLFWKTFNDMKLELPPSEDLCYSFELTSPHNRVVVPHTDTKLTLIGVRDRITGCEYPSSMFAFQFPAVKEYNLKSLDEVVETFKTLSPLSQEGYVIRGARKANGSYARVKVKHPGYVAIHHMRDTLCDRAMLEVIRTGESSEFLTYFPEYAPQFNAIKERLDKLIVELQMDYIAAETAVAVSQPIGILRTAERASKEDQKVFAAKACKSKCSAALFQLRAGKVKTIAEYLGTMNIHNLEETLDKMDRKE